MPRTQVHSRGLGAQRGSASVTMLASPHAHTYPQPRTALGTHHCICSSEQLASEASITVGGASAPKGWREGWDRAWRAPENKAKGFYSVSPGEKGWTEHVCPGKGGQKWGGDFPEG